MKQCRHPLLCNRPWCYMSLALLLLLAWLSSCSPTTDVPSESPIIEAPPNFPPVPIPHDNPVTREKIELGRALFYEQRLSLDNSVSCASCHKQEYAFTDAGKPVSIGVNKEQGTRNTPVIANTAYLSTLSYDGLSSSLEQQSMRAILNPLEMRADTATMMQKLQQDSTYVRAFTRVFGSVQPVTAHNTVRAIATFMRTMLSGNSRYDRFVLGEKTVLNESEQRGKELFFSERTRCASCHTGPDFTDGKFHNTGLYRHYIDKGHYYATNKHSDVGKFKTPSLRNIAITAPYMHDGTLNTLEEVMAHYNRGGHPNINRDTLIHSLQLTDDETADIIHFMETLTDNTLLNNPKFAKP